MIKILAPDESGHFGYVYGQNHRGLFLQTLSANRAAFRHSRSGLTLFFHLGSSNDRNALLTSLPKLYDFERDSTWVLKGLGRLHELLLEQGLSRRWFERAWHYESARPPTTDQGLSTPNNGPGSLDPQ